VILHASSTCKDTDFTAKLIDVHPDGKTMLVLDGVIRAMYRESSRKPVPMEPSTIYGFIISLGEMSHVFKVGHRIQVDISSSNFPRRARNTNSGNPLYMADSERDIIVATNTVYHASKYPSYLVLPVLPPQKPNSFEGTANIKTAQIAYKGPAQLYVFPTAVYLNYGGKWINWKTIKTLREENKDRYESRGKTGTLSVSVQARDKTSLDVLATGPGFYFKGWAK
jgi:sulfur transfer complex TusBCD TusB component (DsrH family)